MGFGKDLAITLLNIVLIISLSTAIMSLTFSLILTEESLNKIVDEGLEPFIDEQIDATFGELTQAEMESKHNSALAICEQNDQYEIGNNEGVSLYLDCERVLGTTQEEFLHEMKNKIKEYSIKPVRDGLSKAIAQLNYFKVALWISVILSVILIVATIIIARGFPFKSFGITGLVAGSPFIFILLSKPLILGKIQAKINNTVPTGIIEKFSGSALMQSINDLFSNLIAGMVLGFAMLFFLGLILLAVGLILTKKENPSS